jgi:hypothetical protein
MFEDLKILKLLGDQPPSTTYEFFFLVLITRRSEVQILSPLPNLSRGYGLSRSPFFFAPR